MPAPFKPHSFRIAYFSKVFWFCVRTINSILVLLTLRSKRKFWGIVYDSVTKQPLDPAIVKLAYLGSNEVETCVTDMEGHYGFLAHPGKFKLLAKKTNYLFPSQTLSGDSDGIFDHLYHGEFFELRGDSEVVAPNIPMDPVGTDWNQQAKISVVNTHPYLHSLIRRLIGTLFWFGFIFVMVFFVAYFRLHVLYLWAALVVYIMLFLLAWLLPDVRLWGIVSNIPEGERVILELLSPSIQGITLGKAEVLPDGKYLLRAKPGSYLLKITGIRGEDVTVYGQLPVKIHAEGVVNQAIKLQ